MAVKGYESFGKVPGSNTVFQVLNIVSDVVARFELAAVSIGAGTASSQIGDTATATGLNSITIGDNSTDGGFDDTVVLGTSAAVGSDSAIAIGKSASATGTSGIVVGDAATDAGEPNCVVIGTGASAGADSSIAVGNGAIAGDDATDVYSIAIGTFSSAKDNWCTCVGTAATADDGSAGGVAIGFNSQLTGAGGVAISGTVTNNGAGIAIGGIAGHADVFGTSDIAIGGFTKAKGWTTPGNGANIALGYSINAYGDGNIVLGYQSFSGWTATSLATQSDENTMIGTRVTNRLRCDYNIIIGYEQYFYDDNVDNIIIGRGDISAFGWHDIVDCIALGANNIFTDTGADEGGNISDSYCIGKSNTIKHNDAILFGVESHTTTKANEGRLGKSGTLWTIPGYFEADIQLQDSVNLSFGTGDDATIDYDGTDLVINPRVVGSGDVDIKGDVTLDDNFNLTFGTGEDATIDYDGTNLVIDPKVVGSGYIDTNGGDLKVQNILFGGEDTATGVGFIEHVQADQSGRIAGLYIAGGYGAGGAGANAGGFQISWNTSTSAATYNNYGGVFTGTCSGGAPTLGALRGVLCQSGFKGTSAATGGTYQLIAVQADPLNTLYDGGTHTNGTIYTYGMFVNSPTALSGVGSQTDWGIYSEEDIEVPAGKGFGLDSDGLVKANSKLYYDSGTSEVRIDTDGTQVLNATTTLVETDVDLQVGSGNTLINSDLDDAGNTFPTRTLRGTYTMNAAGFRSNPTWYWLGRGSTGYTPPENIHLTRLYVQTTNTTIGTAFEVTVYKGSEAAGNVCFTISISTSSTGDWEATDTTVDNVGKDAITTSDAILVKAVTSGGGVFSHATIMLDYTYDT